MAPSLRFIVSGEELRVSRDLWTPLEGPKPPEGFPCDGCSNSPDTLPTGAKLWPACVVHDYHYRTEGVLEPRKWAARRESDWILRRNLNRLLRAQGVGRWRAGKVAWGYWFAVRRFGASSWQHWPEGEEPLSYWQRVRETWGLFRDKRPASRLW